MAWIDGDDPWKSKGRAQKYYALAWAFVAFFLAQVALLALVEDPAVEANAWVGPLANLFLFLALACMVLAYDYRRQWLAFKATAPGA